MQETVWRMFFRTKFQKALRNVVFKELSVHEMVNNIFENPRKNM